MTSPSERTNDGQQPKKNLLTARAQLQAGESPAERAAQSGTTGQRERIESRDAGTVSSSLDLSRFAMPKGAERDAHPSGSLTSATSAAVTKNENVKPWEDRSKSANERYQAYFTFVSDRLSPILDSLKTRALVAGSPQCRASNPAVLLEELQKLCNETPEMFCWRLDGGPLQKLLGSKFLGAEAWWGLGINIGPVPPLPRGLTEDLLKSPCPLREESAIKDTHMLVLLPQTVNGESFTPLKLRELAKSFSQEDDAFTFGNASDDTTWESQPWASEAPKTSRWALIPHVAPDDDRFNSLTLSAQEELLSAKDSNYRMASIAEIMAARWLALVVDPDSEVDLDKLRCSDRMSKFSEDPEIDGEALACLSSEGKEFSVSWEGSEEEDHGCALVYRLEG